MPGPWLLALAVLAQSSAPAASPEVRALWVDGFHAGIRSAREVAELVEIAKSAHLNTLIVQVRRRGDALYTGGLEPVLDDPNYDPAFDGLRSVLDQAHAAGLRVHAWINATPVWRRGAAQGSAPRVQPSRPRQDRRRMLADLVA